MGRYAIRDRNPGSAWNEAERRAVPIAIAGFFVCGLMSSFGFTDLFHHNAAKAALGGGGVGYVIGLSSVVYYYHHRLAEGILAGMAIVGVFVGSGFLLEQLEPRNETLTVTSLSIFMLSLSLYLVLHWRHRKIARLTVLSYLRELDLDMTANARPMRSDVLLWVCFLIGWMVVYLLLRR